MKCRVSDLIDTRQPDKQNIGQPPPTLFFLWFKIGRGGEPVVDKNRWVVYINANTISFHRSFPMRWKEMFTYLGDEYAENYTKYQFARHVLEVL